MTDVKDVVVRASVDDVEHKLRSEFDDPHSMECYWRVLGTPQETGRGAVIWFADGRDIVARGTILRVEDGRIWFTPLHRWSGELLVDPPQQGFRYIEDASEDS